MPPARLTAPEMRALQTLARLGRAPLWRWKQAYKRQHGVKLRSRTTHGLWHRRLILFGWFTDIYTLTPEGEAVLAGEARP